MFFYENPLKWIQKQKLSGDTNQEKTEFGLYTAISGNGNIIVSGATSEEVDGISLAGSAYVFEKQNGTWSQVQKLTSGDNQQINKFGEVAISEDGTTIVSASPAENTNNFSNSGCAYIYQKQNGTWSQVQKISTNDPNNDDLLGYPRISSNGNIIILRSITNDPDNLDAAGAVYVFEKQNGTWSQVQKLTASDKQEKDYFGKTSLSADGNFIAVGINSRDSNGFASNGVVYIFERQNGTWTEVQQLTGSTEHSSNFFSTPYFSPGGNILLVGASGHRVENIFGAGAVYLFERENGSWIEKNKLTIDTPQAADQIGYIDRLSIDKQEKIILLGAANRSSDGITRNGAVFFFYKKGNSWRQLDTLTPSDKAERDYFGSNVLISSDGSTAIISNKPNPLGETTKDSSVYVYESTTFY